MNQIAQQLKEKNIAEYLIYMWQEAVSYTHLDVYKRQDNIHTSFFKHDAFVFIGDGTYP